MTSQTNTSQAPTTDSKELNFRRLEERFERQLAEERAANEKLRQELMQRQNQSDEEDEKDDEPYVDKRRLDKKLSKFGQSTQSEIQKAMEQAKQAAKTELKQELWLEKNSDFSEVMKHAEAFASHDPEFAETILSMPEGFERHKLVYKSIKALGLHKPKDEKKSVQDTINQNARGFSYQPSGMSNPPYTVGGDFSKQGQEAAYQKMQELKSRMRLS